MALLTDRILTVREGWLTVDVTWDDITLRVERILAVCSAPVPTTVRLYRGESAQPWREATLTDGETYDETRPFGGGFNTLDQLQGIGCEVVF